MMATPNQVLHRIMDAENVLNGWIGVHISVRSGLRDLFDAARHEDTPNPTSGHLWQMTYSYSDDQTVDAIVRVVPFMDFSEKFHPTFKDVEVQFMGDSTATEISSWMLSIQISSRSGKRRLYVTGTWPDGDVKTSSAVLTINDEGVVRTISGSTYNLKGMSRFGQSVSDCIAQLGDWVPGDQ